MKNKVLLAVNLLALFGLLVACQSPTPIPVPIRWFIGLGTSPDQSQVDMAQEFVKEFNAAHPQIILTLEIVTGDTARDVLATEIAAGNGPDIVGPVSACAANSLFGQWLDLKSYLTGNDLTIFRADAVGALQVPNQGLIGLPLGLYPSALYVNKKMFDEAGMDYPPLDYGASYPDGVAWDWNKLAKIAKLLTLDANGKNAGEPQFDPSRIVQLGFTLPQADACIQNTVSGDAVSLQQYTLPAGNDPFGSGKAAMAYAYSWYLKSLGTLTNWDFGAVPANPATGVAATALQDDMIGALKSTGHAREAAQVIYAIASHPNLIRVWIAVPAQTSLQAGWVDAMQGRYPGVHWDTLLAGLEHATSPGQCCQTIP